MIIDADHRLDRRTKRLTRLLRGASTTVIDLMRADFGTASPAGLDLKPFKDFTIPLGVINGRGDPRNGRFFNRYFDRGVGGYALYSGEILIAPEYIPGDKDSDLDISDHFRAASILSHEGLHRLQFRAAAAQSDSPAQDNRFTGPVMHLGWDGTVRGAIRGIRTVFNRIGINIEYVEQRNMISQRLLQFMGLNSMNVGNYLARDVEMQARMHEVLVAGHAIWQKMPSTRAELYMALSNVGLTMPKALMYRVLSTQEGRDARKAFAAPLTLVNAVSRTVSDLNRVYDFATTDTAQAALWDHAYPALYGNMLELYGDTLGRERIGLGRSRSPLLNVLEAVNRPGYVGAEDLYERVCAVHPDNALELTNLLISIYLADDCKTRGIVSPRQTAALDCITHLLSQDKTRDAILSPGTVPVYGMRTGYVPLEYAMIGGAEPILRAMLDARADVFRPVTTVHPLDGRSYTRSPISILEHPGWIYRVSSLYPVRQHVGFRDRMEQTAAILGQLPAAERRADRDYWTVTSNQPATGSLDAILARSGLEAKETRQKPVSSHRQQRGLEIRGHF